MIETVFNRLVVTISVDGIADILCAGVRVDAKAGVGEGAFLEKKFRQIGNQSAQLAVLRRQPPKPTRDRGGLVQ